MPKKVLVVVIGLLLASFVSPFSYLPNPIGVLSLVSGGYSYDARRPLLVNRFAVLGRGDVEATLRAKLDGLIATTGLDPLDPNQPLQRYEIETITYGDGDWADATVNMIYADGSSRRYQIPVVESRTSGRGFPSWTYTGLDRLSAPHPELPHRPFAGPGAPIGLGAALRLPLNAETHRLGTGSLVEWYTPGPRSGETPVWSPAGDAFLLAEQPDRRAQQSNSHLWLVPIAGPMAKHVAVNADHATWSPDGNWIVFLRHRRTPIGANGASDATGASDANGRIWEIVAVDREGRKEHALGQTDLAARPAVVGDAVWYLTKGAIWRANLPQAAEAVRVSTLPGLVTNASGDAAFALTPEGERVAYRCEDALCLVDATGQNRIQVDLGAPPRASSPGEEQQDGSARPNPTAPPDPKSSSRTASDRPRINGMALNWNQGGDLLAVVASDDNASATLVLWIVDRAGQALRRVIVGPPGSADDPHTSSIPQWTPDGCWIFLNTFSGTGRRIAAIEAATGRVFELSQPRWDALFSLTPDGRLLLLWNGRGGFWTAGLAFDEATTAASREAPAPSATPTPLPAATARPSTPTPRPTPAPIATVTRTPVARTATPKPTPGRRPTVTAATGAELLRSPTPTPIATRLTGPHSVPPSPRYQPSPLQRDTQLEARIQEYLGDDLSSYGIVVKRLSDGRGFAINADRQFYAASLFKILVMYEVFKQRQLGLLSFDEELTVTPPYLDYMLGGELPWPLWSRVPVGELVDAMITVSDNVAAMMLHDKTGGGNIIRDYRSIGLVHTDLSTADMPTSARDMALWLEMIALGSEVDETTRRDMIDLMRRQKVVDRLPALLPDGIQVAHKTGNWENATHDVGIVYAPSGAYIIAVLSDRSWESKPIAEISRLVFDYFANENPS